MKLVAYLIAALVIFLLAYTAYATWRFRRAFIKREKGEDKPPTHHGPWTGTPPHEED